MKRIFKYGTAVITLYAYLILSYAALVNSIKPIYVPSAQKMASMQNDVPASKSNHQIIQRRHIPLTIKVFSQAALQTATINLPGINNYFVTLLAGRTDFLNFIVYSSLKSRAPPLSC